jgi:Fe-S-cluster containining protein
VDHRKFDIHMRIGRDAVRVELSVPDVPMSLPEFLPIVQGLTQMVVQAAEREARQTERVVSCGPGCGACCRQLVPVAAAEAAALRGVISGLSAAHLERVEGRFSAARDRLRSNDLDRRLRDSAQDNKASRVGLGLEYFALGIACPFLEEESCSIHEQRPLACREYLVTSDPSGCRQPDRSSVETVEIPRRLSQVFRRFAADCLQRDTGWIPLIFALDDSLIDPAAFDTVRMPGPWLLEGFIAAMAAPAEEVPPHGRH